MKKKFVMVLGAMLVTAGIMSMCFRWSDAGEEKKRQELAALPPATRLDCCEVAQLIGRGPYDDRIVKR